MSLSLNILRTYNCRIDAGVVKRGLILDDWLRYGVYYGTPAYLHIHDFANWNILVFDYDVLAQGVDPDDYGNTAVYVYLAFGSRYDLAARKGGYYPPEGNAAELAAIREVIHGEIDAIMDAGFAGVFWDECDTGFWDWSYCLESSDLLKNQLQEYCDYIRSRGGRSFINGCPYYAECGEEFMLESFLSTWRHNLFSPNWYQNDLFIKYTFGLDELGEAGGIPWTTGIYAWLYLKKYVPQAEIFAHSYGDPTSAWQNDKQLFSLAGSLAIGLQSYNYIEPTNQTLVPIWAHNYYIGAPLECPQINVEDKTAARKYTGANVLVNERIETGIIDMNVEPSYWWDLNQDFEDINWEVDGVALSGANRTSGFVPDYLKISNIYFYDDRLEVYYRVQMWDTFEVADVIPLYIYIELDSAIDGFQTARTVTEVPYLHFKNVKAQIYLYGQSLFCWEGGQWRYLYAIRYHQDHVNKYLYYAIRKETLSFAAPNWDKINIKTIPVFVYTNGNSFFVDDNKALYDSCLPLSTLAYYPEYDTIAFKPFVDCPLPYLNDDDELKYNQVITSSSDAKIKSVTCTHHFTIYGYTLSQTTLQDKVYAPHSAVIYNATGQSSKRVSQVDITGNFDKAWIFDRENGQFVGPDDTPDTHYTSSPFSPTKIIDGQDIAVAIAHDDNSKTADTWSVSAVSVTLVDWASSHNQGYDIALPDLIEWQSIYDAWKGARVSDTVSQTYLPAGIKRGGINLRKDSIKGTFTLTVPASGAIAEALEIYDITNAALLMRRTYEDLDHSNPDNIELLVYAYVDSWELTDTELRIRAKLNFHSWGSPFPKRRVSYFCPFVFKGPQCNYGGAAIVCNKTLTECKSMGNDDSFGGIPSLPRLQRGRWG